MGTHGLKPHGIRPVAAECGDVCGTRVSPAGVAEANQRPQQVGMAKSSSWPHKDSPEAKLLKAAHNGSINDVKRLLYWNRNINVNVIDSIERKTPLIWAAMMGHIDIVRMLLAKGADVNVRDKDGSTALIWASNNGDANTVQALLNAGADVHIKDKGGNTALIWAGYNGNPKTIEALLAAGADVNATDAEGKTALQYIRIKNQVLAAEIENNQREFITTIQRAQPDINTIRTLLSQNPYLAHARDTDRVTALMMAVRIGHVKLVELLLEARADVHAKDKTGLNALMMALSIGHVDLVKLLLKAGADVNATDNGGKNAFQFNHADNENEEINTLLETYRRAGEGTTD